MFGLTIIAVVCSSVIALMLGVLALMSIDDELKIINGICCILMVFVLVVLSLMLAYKF